MLSLIGIFGTLLFAPFAAPSPSSQKSHPRPTDRP